MKKSRNMPGMIGHGSAVCIAVPIILIAIGFVSVPDGHALTADRSHILSSYLKGDGVIINFQGLAKFSEITAFLIDDSGRIRDSGNFPVTNQGKYQGIFRLDSTYRAGIYQIQVNEGTGPRYTTFMISDPQILPKKSTDPCPPGICEGGPLFGIDDIDKLTIGFRTVTLALVKAPDKGEAGYVEALTIATSLCTPGSTIFFDIDHDQWAPGQDREVTAEVFCKKQSLNQKLIESGLGTLLTEFCNKSEFSTRQWAQGCVNDPIIESNSESDSLLEKLFNGEQNKKQEQSNVERSKENKSIDLGMLIQENLIMIIVVIVVFVAGGTYVAKHKKIITVDDRPALTGFYVCPKCNGDDFVENDDGSVDCEKCGHVSR